MSREYSSFRTDRRFLAKPARRVVQPALPYSLCMRVLKEKKISGDLRDKCGAQMFWIFLLFQSR